MSAIPKRLGLLVLALAGCGKFADSVFCASAGCDWKPGEWERIAALANPGAPPPDLSNEWRDNSNALELGKKFFFDTAFSGNATQKDAIKRDSPPARAAKDEPIGIACVTCHDLARGGADVSSSPGHVSVGAGWTDVNALSVLNSAYRQVVFWNGRADSLWALNAIVAESSTTLNGNRLKTAHEIATRYADPYQRAFGFLDVAAIASLPANGKPNDAVYDALDPDTKDMVTRVLVNWAKAIAVYEYQLISRDSPFDRFVAEGPGSTAISAAAQRGARLFVGKAACVDCHSGAQLTDDLFHNVGVPQTGLAVPTTADCPAPNPPANPPGSSACDCSDGSIGPCAPWGAWDGLNKLQSSKWLRTEKWSGDRTDTSRNAYLQRGKNLTDALKGAWRTPSLRNVALTAPYMHDGRYATLQDVVWHYNSGAQGAGPEQVGALAPQIRPLLLTDAEQGDLVAFLESLTGAPLDPEMIMDPASVGGGTPGTGGAGGAGGSVGSSGLAGISGPGTGGRPMTGAGGTITGAGGSGGPTLRPQVCTGAPPSSPVIADFEDAVPVDPTVPFIFGTPPRLTGRAFVRTSSANVPPPLVQLGNGLTGKRALVIVRPPQPPGSPTDYYEFGLMFDDCVDASAFSAVQFSATNAVGCAVDVSAISRPNVAGAQDVRGTCTLAPCDPPLTTTALAGFVRVPLASGTSFDPRSMIGIRWRVPGSCVLSAIIDDILFVNP